MTPNIKPSCYKIFKTDSKFHKNISLFKGKIRNASKRCEIYSNLAIKIPERRH